MTRRPAQRLFAHVSDPDLRKVLEARAPGRLRDADLTHAIQVTADDIERAYMDMAVPTEPSAQKALCHLMASQTARRGQKVAAVAWLRNAWRL